MVIFSKLSYWIHAKKSKNKQFLNTKYGNEYIDISQSKTAQQKALKNLSYLPKTESKN